VASSPLEVLAAPGPQQQIGLSGFFWSERKTRQRTHTFLDIFYRAMGACNSCEGAAVATAPRSTAAEAQVLGFLGSLDQKEPQNMT